VALGELLAIERRGRILVATLSRPPVNAINEALLTELEAALDHAATDAGVAVLHLRSNQRAFCAGADLAFMRSCLASTQGREKMIELARRMQRLFARIGRADVITLAEIGGAACGGGLELALACDLRVAASEAALGLPEVGLGLLPAAGGTQRLTRLCGAGVAKRLILGAELITGTTAERLGLVQWARPREELQAWTASFAERIASMPRAALAAGKHCIAAAGDPDGGGFLQEIAITRQLYDDAESARRVAQFLDERTAFR
jgi:enoyl-CoA hydratase